MLRLILLWTTVAFTLLLLTKILPGITVSSVANAFIAALVIGLVNAVIRPIAQLLALPLNILTLGLFAFVVNALMFWLAAGFVPGFQIHNFLSALLGSLVLSVVVTVFDRVATPVHQ